MKGSQITMSLLVVVFSILVREGLSLQCYECDDFQDEGCGNPGKMGALYVKNCTEQQNYCRKIEQEITIKDKDVTKILRQCATRGSPGECLERTGTYQFKTWYCECKGDLCNGASSLSLSVLFLPVLTFICLLKTLAL